MYLLWLISMIGAVACQGEFSAIVFLPIFNFLTFNYDISFNKICSDVFHGIILECRANKCVFFLPDLSDSTV